MSYYAARMSAGTVAPAAPGIASRWSVIDSTATQVGGGAATDAHELQQLTEVGGGVAMARGASGPVWRTTGSLTKRFPVLDFTASDTLSAGSQSAPVPFAIYFTFQPDDFGDDGAIVLCLDSSDPSNAALIVELVR